MRALVALFFCVSLFLKSVDAKEKTKEERLKKPGQYLLQTKKEEKGKNLYCPTMYDYEWQKKLREKKEVSLLMEDGIKGSIDNPPTNGSLGSKHTQITAQPVVLDQELQNKTHSSLKPITPITPMKNGLEKDTVFFFFQKEIPFR